MKLHLFSLDGVSFSLCMKYRETKKSQRIFSNSIQMFTSKYRRLLIYFFELPYRHRIYLISVHIVQKASSFILFSEKFNNKAKDNITYEQNEKKISSFREKFVIAIEKFP